MYIIIYYWLYDSRVRDHVMVYIFRFIITIIVIIIIYYYVSSSAHIL